MMSKIGDTGRDQVEIISLDELVPSEHLVRKIEAAIDWSFIYELVEGSYCYVTTGIYPLKTWGSAPNPEV